jgi:hypothetical protein
VANLEAQWRGVLEEVAVPGDDVVGARLVGEVEGNLEALPALPIFPSTFGS